MTRIALLTEIPAPFRIPLFNALAARDEIELEVLLLAEHDPRRSYKVYAEEFRFSWTVLPGLSVRPGNRWVVLTRGVRRALSHRTPDVIVLGGWNQPAFWQAIAYARRRHIPLVAWVESTLADARPRFSFLATLKQFAVRSCDTYVVPGRASRAYLRAFGAPDGAIFNAPNAVDLGIFAERVDKARHERDALRARLGVTRTTFLYVGRLDPEKGLDVLFAALRELDVDLVAIGSGRDEQRLRDAAPDNVRLIGWLDRDALVQWYAAADAFVLPSLSEPWGMVLNEAATAGLPIVATDAVGAAAELVDDGTSGEIVPAGDVNALALALGRVAADAGFRQRASARSRALAAAHTPDAWATGVAAATATAIQLRLSTRS